MGARAETLLPDDSVPHGGTQLDWVTEVHFGGLRVAEIDVKARWTGARYQLTSQTRTVGAAQYLSDANYLATARGIIERKSVKPLLFTNDYRSADGNQALQIAFDLDGAVGYLIVPADPNADPVARSVRHAAVDPLSALLHVVLGTTADSQAPCGRAVPIFDGRSRYDLLLDYVRDITIAADETAAYDGPGLLCKIRLQPMDGFEMTGDVDPGRWQSRLEMASVSGGRFVVPLRLSLRTDFGGLVARVTQFTMSEDLDGAKSD